MGDQMRLARFLLVPVAAYLAACTPIPETDAELAKRAAAPLFTGMGEFHRVIDTKDAGAQRYFDQGMVLAFGFNHAESIRSFRAAQHLDPSCAMCFWGEALATGPNINVTAKGKAIMSDDEQRAAYVALEKARAVMKTKPEIERDLIDALGKRYAAGGTLDREPFDRAYAEALGERFIARVLPDDAANRGDLAPFFEHVVGCPHSVVTAHLIDAEGEPTRAARDEIIAFFRQRLAG